jgi:hypothetical protein
VKNKFLKVLVLHHNSRNFNISTPEDRAFSAFAPIVNVTVEAPAASELQTTRQAPNISIAKLAEYTIVRGDADIDRIANAFVRKLIEAGERGA